MELTNEIKAKVFGLYLGCEIHGHKNTGIKLSASTLFILLNTEGCKLILTPLENITDADAIAAFDIIGPKETPEHSKINIVKNWIKSKVLDYEIVDFFRSKYYAVDYLGLNLFQSGIAIERTPTVQPRDKEQEQTAYAPFFNPLTGDQIGVVRNTNQTDDPATIYGDGTGYALPPIESHPIDEQQHHNHEHTTK